MTYEEWIRLPEADKLALPESEYPEIPKDQLRNFLTKAVVKKVKGVIGWETTQEYGTRRQTEWFPEFRQKEVGGVMIWYAFDPTEGTYKPNIEREPSMEEEPIGSYGLAWMHFMEDNYPEWVEVLRFQHRYLTEARKVDESAWEYRHVTPSAGRGRQGEGRGKQRPSQGRRNTCAHTAHLPSQGQSGGPGP